LASTTIAARAAIGGRNGSVDAAGARSTAGERAGCEGFACGRSGRTGRGFGEVTRVVSLWAACAKSAYDAPAAASSATTRTTRPAALRRCARRRRTTGCRTPAGTRGGPLPTRATVALRAEDSTRRT
jgi:hypothetical protein